MKKRVFVFLLAIQIGGLYLLREYGAFQRFVPVQTFENQKVKSCNLKDVLKILEQANSTMKTNQAWTCNDFAEYVIQQLARHGIEGRKLFVVRQIGDQGQTHTLVEVFFDTHWMVVDPTFGVSFKNKEGWLSTEQISKLLVLEVDPEIFIVQNNKNPHADLQSYFVSWKSLYTNVLQFKEGVWWAKWILPLRYWWGPKFYYLVFSESQNSYLNLLNIFYFLFTFCLPLALGLIIIWLFAIKRRPGKIKE